MQPGGPGTVAPKPPLSASVSARMAIVTCGLTIVLLEPTRQHRSEEPPHLGADMVLAPDDVAVAVVDHPDAVIFVQLELALDVAPEDIVVDRGGQPPGGAADPGHRPRGGGAGSPLGKATSRRTKLRLFANGDRIGRKG